MKRTTKLLAILLLIALMIPLLTACGQLKGTYREKGGAETLIFDGKGNLTIRSGGVSLYGTYKVKGDTIALVYTDMFGYDENEEYSYSKKGDTITIDGTEYAKVKSSGSGGTGKTILVILLIAAVVGGGALYVKKNGFPAVRRPSRGEVQDTLYRASRSAATRAADVGGRAAATARGLGSAVAAGVAAGKAAGAEARREKRKIEITPYTCCICGRSLEDGATPLGGLASGQEAWIDNRCLQRLQAMSRGDSYEEFEQAARYMQAQSACVDPEVRDALVRFTKKCAARFTPPQEEGFEL